MPNLSFRAFTVTALVLAVTTGASAQERKVHKRGQIFQNVAAEHVRPLLANTAWVSHWWDGQSKPEGKYVRIVWYGADGREHVCLTDDQGVAGGWHQGTYSGHRTTLKFHKVTYPLKKATYPNNNTGYQLLRYDAETGGLTTYLAQSRRWWEGDVGHLQAKIPAVTWEICPNFPSAASLGAKVNTRQTSRFYKTLVAQDPGTRIRRPQYQNENAHTWFGSEAHRNRD
ncbi:hypothetical protein [Ruegeria atlantica]|uniref:hypothetical protein n=1 Tax=Ruegeria atlantica TaxID=81569 RepID=UPI00147F5BB6|nr:hypothetical protein [Ruegeria atlantica]